MQINLNREMRLLEKNVHHQLRLNFKENNPLLKRDNSFRVDNWVVNFPYNYCFFKQQPFSMELVRKLAVINSILGQFYFREDRVLDNYHVSRDDYKRYLLGLCEARILRNLAVGQLLYLCGDKIYMYLYEYEKKYYKALIFEKQHGQKEVSSLLQHQNLVQLGFKVLPICVTFAGFCLIEGIPDKIPACEKMVINYHIAHQLYDDLQDVRRDILKPDRSYLINMLEIYAGQCPLVAENLTETIKTTGIKYKIRNVMLHYLSLSHKYAVQLRFRLFQKQIGYLRLKINQGVKTG